MPACMDHGQHPAPCLPVQPEAPAPRPMRACVDHGQRSAPRPGMGKDQSRATIRSARLVALATLKSKASGRASALAIV